MKSMKHLLAIVLPAIALLALIPAMHAYADRERTVEQKFNTGTMDTIVNFGQAGTASLSGHVTTKPDGTQTLSRLNGTITTNGQTSIIMVEPIGAISTTVMSGPCVGTSAEQIGTVKVISNGHAVKGIIELRWQTSQNCGSLVHAAISTESNAGILTSIQANNNQSPIG